MRLSIVHIIPCVKQHLPQLRELASTLTASGQTRDQVIEQIVAVVDSLIDWSAIGAAVGPAGAVVGSIAEAIDGPVAVALVELYLKLHLPKKA